MGLHAAAYNFRSMDEDATSELPLFELPIVLLPGELMPLHIFEERYKRMIGHCLETEEPFGIVLRDDDGSARRIGCTARVTEVLERFDDGRMDILVTGEEPFRVLERFDGTEYPAGEVEAVDPVRRRRSRRPRRRRRRPRGVRRPRAPSIGLESPRSTGSRKATPTRSPPGSSCRPMTKQRLLELRSEAERMKLLGQALHDLVGMLKRSREIAEAAKMNGKVTFS